MMDGRNIGVSPMDLSRTLDTPLPNIRTILLGLPLLSIAVAASAQQEGNTEACGMLVRDAFRQHHAVPDSGLAARRVIKLTLVQRIGSRLDTTINRAETVEWHGGKMMRSDGMELWSDERTMVIVDRKAKRLRIVDLADKRNIVAAQQRFNAGFPDSLVGYARALRCEEVKVKGGERTLVHFRIDTAMQQFFNAQSMTVEIDQGGEIVRMEILHPSTSAVRSTEYVVEEIDHGWKDPATSGPILNRFFDESGKLRPEYAGYHK